MFKKNTYKIFLKTILKTIKYNQELSYKTFNNIQYCYSIRVYYSGRFSGLVAKLCLQNLMKSHEVRSNLISGGLFHVKVSHLSGLPEKKRNAFERQ